MIFQITPTRSMGWVSFCGSKGSRRRAPAVRAGHPWENPASYAGAYVGRATIRFNRQQLADALGDFERAISIFQKQIADLEMKAITDDSKGRQGKVAAERRRGLELNAELQRRSIRDGRGTS